MSLNNTSDRYNYIFGSAVRKQEPVRPSYIPDPEPKVKKVKKKKKVQAQEFDWKYMVIVSVAICALIVSAIFYVQGTVVLNGLYRELTDLKEEKTMLLSRQTALETEIEKATNLEEIGKYAKKELGMVYPTKDQIMYYSDDSNDYVRQYESVATDK